MFKFFSKWLPLGAAGFQNYFMIEEDSVSPWNNWDAVCKTAPATLGLLITIITSNPLQFQEGKYKFSIFIWLHDHARDGKSGIWCNKTKNKKELSIFISMRNKQKQQEQEQENR